MQVKGETSVHPDPVKTTLSLHPRAPEARAVHVRNTWYFVVAYTTCVWFTSNTTAQALSFSSRAQNGCRYYAGTSVHPDHP